MARAVEGASRREAARLGLSLSRKKNRTHMDTTAPAPAPADPEPETPRPGPRLVDEKKEADAPAPPSITPDQRAQSCMAAIKAVLEKHRCEIRVGVHFRGEPIGVETQRALGIETAPMITPV